LVKKFKEKGLLISVENQMRPHEKRPERKKQSKEHVNILDGQGLFDFSSKGGLMFTHITGSDEALVIDCVSGDFDQPIAQSPNIFDTRWHDIATNLLRSLEISRDHVSVTPQMQMKILLFRRSHTVFKFHHLNSSRRMRM
jgi:hypothetical protein